MASGSGESFSTVQFRQSPLAPGIDLQVSKVGSAVGAMLSGHPAEGLDPGHGTPKACRREGAACFRGDAARVKSL